MGQKLEKKNIGKIRNPPYSGLLISDNIVPCLNFGWAWFVVPDVPMKVRMCGIKEGNLFQGFLAVVSRMNHVCAQQSANFPFSSIFTLFQRV